MTLRKDTDVWLVGQPLPTIACSSLPNGREIYRHFLYVKHQLGEPKHVSLNSSKHASKPSFLGLVALQTLEAVKQFWERANIPIKSERSCMYVTQNHFCLLIIAF